MMARQLCICVFLLAAAAHAAPLSKPIVIPLSKEIMVPSSKELRGPSSPAPRTFYVGDIHVGGAEGETRSQTLRVLFDVSSGQVILDSTRCQAMPCLMHTRYAPRSFTDISVDGRLVKNGMTGGSAEVGIALLGLGEGSVSGDFVRDRICLANKCFDMNLLVATNMSLAPFARTPFDGVIGLGLKGLSINQGFNFFGRLAAAARLSPQFAFYIPSEGASDTAELTLGGHNAARLASPLAWVPVMNPKDVFWQVWIKEVRVGNWTFDACEGSGCPGAIDTSSSYMGVPSAILDRLAGNGGICGRAANPDLHLTLSTGTVLTLTAKDYVGRDGEQCASLLYPVDAPIIERAGQFVQGKETVRQGGLDPQTFILGEPLLRRYYTVFDWESAQIGFGLAVGSAPVEAPAQQAVAAAAATPPAASPAAPVATKAIFLLQKGTTCTKI